MDNKEEPHHHHHLEDIMKVPMALAEMVSEFTGMRRTPDAHHLNSMKRCKCDASCDGCSRVASRAPSGRSTPIRKMSGEHHNKHSLKIMVGAEEIPVVSQTPSGTQTPQRQHDDLHAHSYYYHRHGHHHHPHHHQLHPAELRRQAMSTAACANALNEKLTIIQKRQSESQQGEAMEVDESSCPKAADIQPCASTVTI